MSIFVKANSKFNDPREANDKGNVEGILETCIAIQGQAKSNTKVDTGYLKGSITYKTFNKEGIIESPADNSNQLTLQAKINEGYVGTNVKYGIYNEFGTRKMRPQAFLRPAGLIVKQPGHVKEIIDIFNKEMGKKLPKA